MYALIAAVSSCRRASYLHFLKKVCSVPAVPNFYSEICYYGFCSMIFKNVQIFHQNLIYCWIPCLQQTTDIKLLSAINQYSVFK